MTKELQAPLTGFKLKGNPKFPMDMARLRGSQLALEADGEAFRAAVLLWGAAWASDPAGSLPNNETALCSAAGFGRHLEKWNGVREAALRGFVLCSDGRLYHTVVCEQARAIWGKGTRRSRQAKEAAEARWKGRKKNNGDKADTSPPEVEGMRDAMPTAMPTAMRAHESVTKSKADKKPNPVEATVTKAPALAKALANGALTVGLPSVRDSKHGPSGNHNIGLQTFPSDEAHQQGESDQQLPATLGDRGVRGVNRETLSRKSSRSDQGSRLPEGWQPTDALVAYGEKLGLTRAQVEDIAEDMRIWGEANGHRAVARKTGDNGWARTFQGFLRRESKKLLRQRELDEKRRVRDQRNGLSFVDLARGKRPDRLT